MAERFDKFTDDARRVLTLAQEESIRFRHNYINTEHLLLGLMRAGDGVAVTVLTNLGVPTGKVTTAVEFIVSPGEMALPGQVGLTPRAKKVIELAVEEARRFNHSYIGTEHLLLGLIREGEGIAFGVLDSLGVSLDQAREETESVLANLTEEPDATVDPARFEEVYRPAAPSPAIEEMKRQSAYAALQFALDQMVTIPDERPERDLVEALLRPLLLTLTDDLATLENDSPRGSAARQRIERVLPSLANTASVASRHGHAGLGEALTKAMIAVMDVLTPPP